MKEYTAEQKRKIKALRKVTVGDGTPRNPIEIADEQVAHAVFTYKAMAGMTRDGTAVLNGVLEAAGFDLEKAYWREEHPEDNQVDFIQVREWD